MLNIAVVDCDTVSCIQIITALENFFGYAKTHIDEYSRGETLLSEILNGASYDIIFLDVNLKGLDGISVGKTLRQYDPLENIILIYISASTDCLEQLFATHPYDFVKKPIDTDRLYSILSGLFSFLLKRRKVITVSFKKNLVNIPVNEIVYIESQERKIIIHLSNKTYEAYEKLDIILQKINSLSDNFIKVHRSYIVNFLYVEQISSKDIIINNQIIPIGPKYKDTLLLQLSH